MGVAGNCSRLVQVASLHFRFLALMVVDLGETRLDRNQSVEQVLCKKGCRRRCLYTRILDYFQGHSCVDRLVMLILPIVRPCYGNLSSSQSAWATEFVLRLSSEGASHAFGSLVLEKEPGMVEFDYVSG